LLVVETSSREDYAPTRHFYESHGYDRAARLADYYAPGDDRVLYTKHFVESQSSLARQRNFPRSNAESARNE
jgi:ribosomal protein S18 acetylase RimI-like enzyme